MKPHPRIRRSIKWAGAGVGVVIAGAFVASLRWGVDASYWGARLDRDRIRGVVVDRGVVTYLSIPPTPDGDPIPGFSCSTRRSRDQISWLPFWVLDSSATFVEVPLWLPLALVVIPTALLFYLDRTSARRRRAGLCPGCGYDLTGLPGEAVCPECNTARVSA